MRAFVDTIQARATTKMRTPLTFVCLEIFGSRTAFDLLSLVVDDFSGLKGVSVEAACEFVSWYRVAACGIAVTINVGVATKLFLA